MRRAFAAILVVAAWCVAPLARAQDFCTDVHAILAAALTEFATMTGPAMADTPSPDITIYSGLQSLTGAGACAVAQQNERGRRYATSYTCANAGADDQRGLQTLRSALQQCLDVTDWSVQTPIGPRSPLVAQYGLIRLSITRNGARGGLALGVEVFRDANGEVMGSPLRGNRTEANGAQRCTPKSPEEIAAFLTRYGALPGAERFEDERFIGFRNAVSHPVISFATRPTHPAHPAIIVRDVYERDGSTFVTAGGDFAGDCEAFQALLQEVQEMNRNLRR